MTFSLKSRPRHLFRAALIFILLLFLTQTLISYFLGKSKTKIIDYLNNNFAYKFSLDSISFGFLKGVYLKNMSISYLGQDKPTISLNGASIYAVPVFFHKIVVMRINIKEYLLFSKKEKEGINVQVIFSDIFKKANELASGPMRIDYSNLSLGIKLSKIIAVDAEYRPGQSRLFLKNTRINIKNGTKVKLKSEMVAVYHDIVQNFKGNLQGTVKNKDFLIDFLFLNLGSSEIFGTGLIQDFPEKNPYINLSFMGKPVSISDFEFLKNNLDVDGFISTIFNFSGTLDKITASINGKFEGCSLRYPLSKTRIFAFKNINGRFEYKNAVVKLENVSIQFSRLPLIINLKADLGKEPNIWLKVFLSKSFIINQKLPLEKIEAEFQGKISKVIAGTLDIKTYYIRGGQSFEMYANLGDAVFEYGAPQERRLAAGIMELTKNDISGMQKLHFVNLKAIIYTDNDLLKIKNIGFAGYNGIFKADLTFNLEDKPTLFIKLSGKNLDIKRLSEDLRLTNKFLSGKLDTEITFNNDSGEFLKGACFIKNGAVNLDALSETVKLPSLKRTDFDIIQMYFSVSKQMAKMRGVRLAGPDIKLHAYWDIDTAIKGRLNMKIKTALLNKSPQFRKLISLTGIKTADIDFRFLLGGIPRAIRAQWLKGEFKEAMEHSLPLWVKRTIQVNLNNMIDGLSNN